MATRGRKKLTPDQRPPSPAPSAIWDAGDEPPDYLSEIASNEWLRVVALLRKAGRLNTTDARLVELYAVNYSMLKQAAIQVELDGPCTAGPRGNLVAHPATTVIN